MKLFSVRKKEEPVLGLRVLLLLNNLTYTLRRAVKDKGGPVLGLQAPLLLHYTT